jgi:2-methylcitrate dehydratase PrpD
MNAVEKIITFACANHIIPDTVRELAEMHLRDTLAVGIAGSTAPGADGVRTTAAMAGTGDHARILGTTQRLPAQGAAFANGFQIHCLEWDAVHEPAVVHALSVVVASLLAVSDRRGGVTETQFLDALCIGVDIAAGIGISSKSAMRFFRPATAGLLGASLACARLEKMSAAQMHDVFGLAYSQVCGTMQAHAEGTIALPLQVAFAARAAVTSVDLVRNGLTGPHDVLEGTFGFFRLVEPDYNLSNYLDTLGKHWLIADISTKPFPTGRAGHGSLSALQRLQKHNGFSAGDVAAIQIHLPPLAYRLVARPAKPEMTPAYARLCLPYLAAMMLTHGTIMPQQFPSVVLPNKRLLELAARIMPVENAHHDVNALVPQRLILALTDGRRFDEKITDVSGSPTLPVTHAETSAKLSDCLALAHSALATAQKALLIDTPLTFAVSG